MAKMSDKMLAKRMVQVRAQGGYKIGPFLRFNAKGYVVLVLYFGAMLAFLAYVQMWTVFSGIACFVCGVFIRDVSWLVGLRRTWEFSRKIIDWDRVKRVADGETLA